MAEALDELRELLRDRISKYNKDQLAKLLKQLRQEKKRRAHKGKTTKK